MEIKLSRHPRVLKVESLIPHVPTFRMAWPGHVWDVQMSDKSFRGSAHDEKKNTGLM
jgi:hypothetical protein